MRYCSTCIMSVLDGGGGNGIIECTAFSAWDDDRVESTCMRGVSPLAAIWVVIETNVTVSDS